MLDDIRTIFDRIILIKVTHRTIMFAAHVCADIIPIQQAQCESRTIDSLVDITAYLRPNNFV
ncbi:hypothetical protein D3C71_2164150 [compost metagenome]